MKDKDIMTIPEFVESVRIGALTDDNGCGYYMKLRKGKKVKTRVRAIPSYAARGKIPPWAAHVVWYGGEGVR